MDEASGEGHNGAPWLAIAVVVLVMVASGALVLLMKQASRPAELEGEGSGSGHAHAAARPGRDAPALPPAYRKLGEMPVVSEDRVVLNGLIPAAKACLDLDGSAATPDLGARAGYLGVLMEVEQTGRPARAAATSFAGASLPAPQAACLSAALLKLQFARASTTRLLQRRYYLGGGAPPVEPPIPEQPTAADLASSLRALGDLGAQCPTLAPQPPAALAAWGAQVVVGPEGEPAWRWSEPTLAPDADACLSGVIGRLRLPATQTASTVVLSLSCAGTGCNLAGSMNQKTEIVE
jgi:hypothetical protein